MRTFTLTITALCIVGFFLALSSIREKPKPTFTINAATDFSTRFPTCSDKGDYYIIRIPKCTKEAVSGLIHCSECHKKGEY